MKIQTVDNKEYIDIVRQAIKENNGYCPCQLLHNKDTKCICKNFREDIPIGEECLCGLYIKVD